MQEPLAQQTIFQHTAQVLRLSLGKGRNGGSACAPGSQQLQNKLLVLARGNFFHVSDPSNFYLGTLSAGGSVPAKIWADTTAIEKKFCKNEPRS